METVLTEKDYCTFYKSVIYGDINSDIIYIAIKSSYRDVCRTITGFSKNEKHDLIFEKAVKTLYNEINKMLSTKITKQFEFDMWHKECCDKMIESFDKQKFYYGQAQKWINMTLKNLSMLEHKKVKKQYEFFHIPIDNYIVEITGDSLSTAWSRLDDYEEYLMYQNNFRNKYDGIPLDNEFKLWLKATRNV